MTDIPNIPLPDRFEPTHRRNLGPDVQVLAAIGNGRFLARFENGGIGVWDRSALAPLRPSLPKAREGFYLLSRERWFSMEIRDLASAWRSMGSTNWIAVTRLCADGRHYHVIDRDGTLGDPVEVEGAG